MIRRLTGTVVDAGVTHVVLDVNGVGYLIYTTSTGTNWELESEASFWTYLAVRETALDIYGFLTRDELEVFELLLSLPKIGPKSAAQILANADVELIKKAVATEDPVYLSKMSGITKKSSEKIVMGLKDKFTDLPHYSDADTAASGTATVFQSETIDALVSLGYPQKDARDAVFNLAKDITNTSDALKEALKQLSS